MRVRLEAVDGPIDVEVVVDDPSATVADLAQALAAEALAAEALAAEALAAEEPAAEEPASLAPQACAVGLVIDGTWRAGSAPLLESGLVEGCTVAPPSAMIDRSRPAPGCEATGPGGTSLELRCTAGQGSGLRWPLPEGPFVVGRGRAADARVDDAALSARHCRVLVEAGQAWVTDLGSGGGTWIDGERVDTATRLDEGRILRLGTGCYRVVGVPGDRPSAVHVDPRGRMSGTVLFHRPPRPAPADPPGPVDAPAAEPPEPGLGPIGIAAVAGPVILAAVMVVLLGSWVFGLLALGGALVALGTAAESRMRRSRHRRRARRRHAAALAELERQADRHREATRSQRWATVCDPAEVVRRATQPSTRLWERRLGDGDWMRLMVGVGAVDHEVPVRAGAPSDHLPAAAVGALRRPLGDVPVIVELCDRAVVGICGSGARRDAVARSLVAQAAVTAGPADLAIVVVADPGRARTWAWTRWLPHTRVDGFDGPTVVTDPDRVRALSAALAAPQDRRAVLIVVDGDDVLSARGSPARRLLGRATSGIVVTDAADRVPSSASALIEVGEDGLAGVTWPGRGQRVDGVVPVAVPAELAEHTARHLARFDDADDDSGGGSGLPDRVALTPLLGLGDLDATAVARHWAQEPRMRAVLGVTADGVADVDLVTDGPHALVAGTTGSGKSELLRDLVVSLALAVDPEHLNFVLVDYKGGSAFDRCAELPHTVGYVTDLDAHLGARALTCLEAELAHRERVLRQHGAADIAELHAAMRHPPLPRLVVVVDEFAALAAELGDFVPSLVGIAQRGRSLGVHLVLATQRPAGAVTDDIRANTNLRVCLRVQDEHDSMDVIGVADAARLDRGRPGRALLRLGHGELLAVQSAHCTGPVRCDVTAPVRLDRSAQPGPGDVTAATTTELGAAVDAVATAFARSGLTLPRRPWPEPLPHSVDLGHLPCAAGEVQPEGIVVGIVDDPRHQRRRPLAWDPARGNLLVVGRARSGRSTTLTAVVAAAALRWSPSELHVYGLDGGGEGLADLARLPHTSAVVGSGDDERARRLVARLVAELDGRLAGRRSKQPRVVLAVDGWIGPGRPASDVEAQRQRDALARLWSDGPAVGVNVIASADRIGAVESALTAITAQKWLLEPAEQTELDLARIPRQLRPSFVAGRVIAAEVGLEAQIGLPGAVLTDAARRWPPTGGPDPIGALPDLVTVDELQPPQVTAGGWWLPLGIGDTDLSTVGIVLRPAHHLLVAGPRRSGRSAVLGLIAVQLRRIRVPTWILDLPVDGGLVAKARSFADGAVLELTELVARLAGGGEAAVLLVDDAERVADPAGVLALLVGDPTCPLSIVAAGRSDALRQSYGLWAREVAASGLGLLLRPDADLDGDLVGVRLARHRWAGPSPVGRGVLVRDGEAEIVQLAGATCMETTRNSM